MVNSYGGIRSCGDDDLKKLSKDTTRLHLVVDMSRLGAKLFNVKMEYIHFPPRSGKNHLFEMMISNWPEPNTMMWATTSIPIEYKPQAEAIAKECGLRIADGVPTMFSGKGPQYFPINGPTVFTLENMEGHQAYRNDQANYQKLLKEEIALCEAIQNNDRAKLIAEMEGQGYSPDQIKRILSHWDNGNEDYNETPAKGASDGSHQHRNVI